MIILNLSCPAVSHICIVINFLLSSSEICLTEKEFLDAIPKTIEQIESYCTTTIRASVGNYLVSLYIKENMNRIT